MQFNSWSFLFLFLPLFLLVWRYPGFLAAANARDKVLLCFSLVFYAFWSFAGLCVFALMAAVNYYLANLIADFPAEGKGKQILLACAVVFNLLPLAWFKYSFFFISNVALIFNADWEFAPPAAFPGISFFVFIQIAWLVDVYKKKIAPEGLARHALFSGCFPYLISGPIVRYEQVGWQYEKLSEASPISFAAGLTLFALGLAKKVILADSIGLYADAVFRAAEIDWVISAGEAWLGAFCYAFQLYFDFSGYVDMALGIGLMIGLRLPENFNSPYKSTGIVEFWRRWHITLSSWLRDYLYVPLGGNRRGKPRQYLNLFLTMLLGGFWHGAGWTYLLWGGMHGGMLCANHYFRSQVKARGWTWTNIAPVRVFSIALTFILVTLAWVPFRAFSLDGALNVYAAMFGGGDTAGTTPEDLRSLWDAILPNGYFNGWEPFVLICVCAFICWACPTSRQILYSSQKVLRWQTNLTWATAMGVLFFVSLLFLSRRTAFLYFQF